jgi:hypothetical protein
MRMGLQAFWDVVCEDGPSVGGRREGPFGDRPGSFPKAHRVAMKTMANSEATAVRLQKTCMDQRQCRQKSSIQAMTIAALPTIV